MITVTLQYDSIYEAHAVLGTLLAQAPIVVVETVETVPLETVEATPPAPAPKKRGRPRKKTPKIYSSEEVAALKDEFSAYTKDKGFIKAKALLNEFENVRRFGDLASHQHEKFHQLMNTEAA